MTDIGYVEFFLKFNEKGSGRFSTEKCIVVFSVEQ